MAIQDQVDAIQAFTNKELPLKRTLLKSSAPDVLYDGDPNDGGAPAIIQNSPLGTWYHREADDTFWKRHLTVWVVEIVGRTRTLEAMVIPVDFNDGSAIDPPSDEILDSQSVIDNLLADAGATNFKHIRLVINALPRTIAHEVLINCAAGVHRPDPTAAATFVGFTLDVFHEFDGGQIAVQGAAPSTWTALAGLSGLTIDAKSAPTAIGSCFLDFSTSHPAVFAGLDLRGLHVTTDTGDVIVIHDHTNDVLEVVHNPMASAATATVARPSTVFRSSDTDVPNFTYFGCFSIAWAGFQGGFTFTGNGFGEVAFNDCRFDTWSTSTASQAISSSGVLVGVTRCLVDYEVQLADFGVPPQGRAFQCSGPSEASFSGAGITLNDTGVKSTPGSGSTFESLFASSGSGAGLDGSVIYGIRRGVIVERGGNFFMQNGVIRKTGDTGGRSILLSACSHFFAQTFSFNSGIRNSIFDRSVHIDGAYQDNVGRFTLSIGDMVGTPGILCLGDVRVDNFSAGIGHFLDLGGNTDVGIEVAGSFNLLKLSAGTTVTGTIGDVRFEGVITAYGALGTVAAPTIGVALNSIGKG